MPRRASEVDPKDPTYLTTRGGVFYVQMAVPKEAQAALGRKTLEKSLRTKDRSQALAARFDVITEFRRLIRQGTGKRLGDVALPKAGHLSPRGLLEVAADIRNRETAGKINAEEAEAEQQALLDAYLAHRAKEVPADEEGAPRLPAQEVAQVRRAMRAASGTDAYLLETLADQWLKLIARSKVKPSTVEARRRHVAMLTDWLGPDKEPSSVDKPMAARFVEEVLNGWGVSPETPDGVTAETRRFALNSIQKFFDWIEVRGLIKFNPFDKAGALLSSGGGNGPDRRSWTPEELQIVLQAIPEGDSMFPLVAVLAYSGMRREEVCAMRVESVTGEVMQVEEGKTKTARRLVPIHPTVAPLVELLVKTSPDGYLIPGLGTAGRDEKRSILIGKRLLRTMRAAGVTDERVVVHGLRRTVSTQMEAKGVDLFVRQQILGHASGNITEAVYTDPVSVTRRAKAIREIGYGAEVAGLVGRRTIALQETSPAKIPERKAKK